MIINQKNESVPVIYGENTVKRATINPDELAKLQYLLTKGLYSNPVGATIVEWTNNAVDSVVMSGKDPIKTPVIVEIGATGGFRNYFFRVSDKGLGLNKDEFENVCMSYLSSTKTATNDAIGAFGIGMKSFLSLEKTALFTCRKDGYEWKFMAYQGEEFVEYNILHEGVTEEENGVICEIPLKDYSEKLNFVTEAKYRLAYYETVVLIIDNNVVENTIFRETHFQWSSLIDKHRPMHLSLKDVYYEIDFNKLNIPTVYLPICLRFNLEDGLQPTPSRESLIYNEATRDAIMKRLTEFANWVIAKYNEDLKPNNSIIDVWQNIDDHKPIYRLQGKELELEKLAKYADVVPLPLKVEGIVHKPLKWYKQEVDNLVADYDVVHEVFPHGRSRRKHFTFISSTLKSNKKIILITGKMALRGILGSYILNHLNPNGGIYVVKTERTKRLKPIRHDLYDKSYYTLLKLGDTPKERWREVIKEWQLVVSQVSSSFIDLTNIENDETYLAFYEEEKKRRKDLLVQNSTYKALNKQEGEITIQEAKKSKRAESGITYVKETVKVDSFYKKGRLFVIMEDKDEPLVKMMANGGTIFKFIKVGPREIKKLPKSHNIITMQEFIEKSKPFRRVATGIRVDKCLESFKSLGKSTNALIMDYSGRMKELSEKLSNYLKRNNFYSEEDVTSAITQLAEAGNFWDTEIIDDVIKFEELIKTFEFVKCLNNDNGDAEYKKVISQMLIFRKKFKGAFDDYELVKKEPVVMAELIVGDEVEEMIEDYNPEDNEIEEEIEEEVEEDFPF